MMLFQYNNRGRADVNSLDMDKTSTLIIISLFCIIVLYVIIKVWLGLRKENKYKDN